MGNRAVITVGYKGLNGEVNKYSGEEIGIYLHWNGGYDSVSAFLKYSELKGYASPEKDSYGWARLCQVIGNYFGGNLSLGIGKCKDLDCDNFDNGVYLIQDWKIVGRCHHSGKEQKEYDLLEMLFDINRAMPVCEQLDEEFIKENFNKNL